jgi:hypothetical protein
MEFWLEMFPAVLDSLLLQQTTLKEHPGQWVPIRTIESRDHV